MIYSLAPVTAAQKVLAQLAKIEINALLQMGIEVLKKENDGTFLIRLGRHTLHTKSEASLVPGKEYWVDIEESKNGIIRLTKLHPKPEIFKKEGFIPIGGSELLSSLTKESDPVEALKERILHMIVSSQSKEQFQNLAQMLLSLHQGIITITFKEKGRQALLQMRKKDTKKSSIEFYAALNNLGPIRGEILNIDGELFLNLTLFYQKSAKALQKLKSELKSFQKISIKTTSSYLFPLLESNKLALLDIKG